MSQALFEIELYIPKTYGRTSIMTQGFGSKMNVALIQLFTIGQHHFYCKSVTPLKLSTVSATKKSN